MEPLSYLPTSVCSPHWEKKVDFFSSSKVCHSAHRVTPIFPPLFFPPPSQITNHSTTTSRRYLAYHSMIQISYITWGTPTDGCHLGRYEPRRRRRRQQQQQRAGCVWYTLEKGREVFDCLHGGLLGYSGIKVCCQFNVTSNGEQVVGDLSCRM